MMRRILPVLFATFWGLVSCSQSSSSAPPPAKPEPVAAAVAPAPAPPRISFDNQCFMIDGKDTFLYSGAFHYFRCPKPLWADRFQKMKDAGLNCVETYVAWNWHEQQPPVGLDDFSKLDMSDLSDWLDMAINHYGFYVILRPGPYICAEWDGGGYPQWLVTKKPADARKNWLRSDDPVYLDWCKHWYTAVAKTVVPFQITHRPAGKPGVILWQIENEYNYANIPRAAKLNQLRALAHDSIDMGIDVPLITCMTSDTLKQDKFLKDNVIECRNTYPWFRPDDELRALTPLETFQPEKPKMVTELQGGWFSENGGQLNSEMGFTPQQLTHVTLLAWAHGYTGTNYYMMFGGTNLGDWGSANKTTTYDYAAPIHEWGGVGPRYYAVRAMANFLQQHGLQLARSAAVDTVQESPSDDGVSSVLRRGKDGSQFLFVFNDQNNNRAVGDLHVHLGTTGAVEAAVHYDLDPYDAKILYFPPGMNDPARARWFPEPVAAPERPTNLPPTVTITDARMQVDPGPASDSWQDLPDGGSVEDAGIFDRRYVYYRSAPLGATTRPMMVSASLAEHDSFIGKLDGTRLNTERHGREMIAAVFPPITGDDSQLLLLYENGGRDNGGGIDARCGLRNLSVSGGAVLPKALTEWTQRREDGDPLPDTAADVDSSSWSATDVTTRPSQVDPHQTATFRSNVELTDEELKAGGRFLTFGRISGESRVFLNGHELPSQTPPKFDVSSLLQAGRNSVAVIVKANTRAAGIGGGAELDPIQPPQSMPIHWQISGESAGTTGKWWNPDLDDSNWENVRLGAADRITSPANSANLCWYRMQFSLPAPDAHVWVPWKLNLAAHGNGFIYLNGHFLGRWWEIGPQRDFYLPECWLNFGPGTANNVTLCLRPTGYSDVISAKVAPYGDFAEAR